MTTLALAVATAAPAQTQDAKAAEVLAKTRQALGGAKLDSLKTVSVQLETQRNLGSMQMSSDVELLLELPDKYVRSEESRGGMSMSMRSGFNGDANIAPAGVPIAGPGGSMVVRMGPGGSFSANDGPKPTPEQQADLNKAALRAQRAEVSRLMLGWFGMAHPTLPVQYTYAGEAESPDGKAHVIDVKDTDGFAARLFIDQNNYLPLMVSYQGRAPRVMTAGAPAQGGASGQMVHRIERGSASAEDLKKMASDMEKQGPPAPVDISMFFDDWRTVDGIQFPHVMRRASGGTTSEEWAITKVKVNAKIDAKKFAVDSK